MDLSLLLLESARNLFHCRLANTARRYPAWFYRAQPAVSDTEYKRIPRIHQAISFQVEKSEVFASETIDESDF